MQHHIYKLLKEREETHENKGDVLVFERRELILIEEKIPKTTSRSERRKAGFNCIKTSFIDNTVLLGQ